MGEPRDKHDPHDPRGGSTNPTGLQGPDGQEEWQKSEVGEEAVREASTTAAGSQSEPQAEDDK